MFKALKTKVDNFSMSAFVLAKGKCEHGWLSIVLWWNKFIPEGCILWTY